MSSRNDEELAEGLLSGVQKPRLPASHDLRRILKGTLPVVVLIGLAVLLLPRARTLHPELDLPDNFKPDWAQYSPYIPQSPYFRPHDCDITQVSRELCSGSAGAQSNSGQHCEQGVVQTRA